MVPQADQALDLIVVKLLPAQPQNFPEPPSFTRPHPHLGLATTIRRLFHLAATRPPSLASNYEEPNQPHVDLAWIRCHPVLGSPRIRIFLARQFTWCLKGLLPKVPVPGVLLLPVSITL